MTKMAKEKLAKASLPSRMELHKNDNSKEDELEEIREECAKEFTFKPKKAK